MTENSEPADPPVGPERLDMSMNADANVQWANPDALTRDQTIRLQSFALALQVDRLLNLDEHLFNAEMIATYIKDGVRV